MELWHLCTFDVFFHLEIVLEEEDAFALRETATEHAIELDARLAHVVARRVHNGGVHGVARVVHPIWRQEADAARQEGDGEQQKSDGARQTHLAAFTCALTTPLCPLSLYDTTAIYTGWPKK